LRVGVLDDAFMAAGFLAGAFMALGSAGSAVLMAGGGVMAAGAAGAGTSFFSFGLSLAQATSTKLDKRVIRIIAFFFMVFLLGVVFRDMLCLV
jgi:hypothetical protein